LCGLGLGLVNGYVVGLGLGLSTIISIIISHIHARRNEMTGEGKPLKRLVPKMAGGGLREKCDDRVVVRARVSDDDDDRRIGVNIVEIY